LSLRASVKQSSGNARSGVLDCVVAILLAKTAVSVTRPSLESTLFNKIECA